MCAARFARVATQREHSQLVFAANVAARSGNLHPAANASSYVRTERHDEHSVPANFTDPRICQSMPHRVHTRHPSERGRNEPT